MENEDGRQFSLNTIESRLVWLLWLLYGNVIENECGNEMVVTSRRSK